MLDTMTLSPLFFALFIFHMRPPYLISVSSLFILWLSFLSLHIFLPHPAYLVISLSIENLVKYVTTMVCVAVDGKPVIGVIHQPFTGFTAWAFVGVGSNMRPRSSYSVSPPKVIVSRSHSGKVKSFVHDAFGNTTIVEAGGAGYKVLSLLEMPADTIDQADVYIHITFIKKWDICAGAALLNHMGGHMTTLKGEDIDYSGTPVNKGGLVVSVGVDHKAMLERLPNWDPEKH
nr:inositol monophosphatase 3-like [Monopterus albus]